ncbi:unnamed protein product [Urochloa decumbens]|uniref:Uncharacterized protein n=1 Tax=Urochloa decumbens TaxID=240449 RepID=A0ABC9D721_9POAL
MVQRLSVKSVEEAIRNIVPYLESLNDTVYKAIYFDGWPDGLGASAVLRAIAEQPSFLMKKFDKVIHIDCLRWKNRRALQRAIADELKLPQQVMSLFDRQDEEDDFSMVDEGSRAEIGEVARVILGSLLQYRCLVLFHNGSNDVVDLYGCGLPPPGISGTTVLWTFGGRLRRGYEVKVDKSHVFISCTVSNLNFLVWEEAKEISLYKRKLGLGITPGIVRECLLYLLILDNRSWKIMDYNWLIHASNYWVCDGIILGGQESNKAWEYHTGFAELVQATGLKTLVLDGCIGLEHICPEGLSPSLETFCLDAGSDPKFSARLSKISLAGCVHLKNFLLRGALPELEELNLSGTSIRKVDLSDQVVQVRGLKKLFLIGCKQLRGILWWEGSRELNVLCISTHGRNSDDLRPSYSDSSPIIIQRKKYNGYVIASDVRIIQSLLLIRSFLLITRSLYLHLYVPPSSSSSKGQSISSEAAMSKACHYGDVLLQLHGVVAIAYGEITSWPAPLNFHVEVGEGISFTDMESDKAIKAMNFMMKHQIESLHVHDNSRILTVTPKLSSLEQAQLGSHHIDLEWCRVERCPKPLLWLKYVLPFRGYTFPSLETLNITHCGDLRQVFPWDDDVNLPRRREVKKFQNLKHIHLHDLPSLQGICEGGVMVANSAAVIAAIRMKVRDCLVCVFARIFLKDKLMPDVLCAFRHQVGVV